MLSLASVLMSDAEESYDDVKRNLKPGRMSKNDQKLLRKSRKKTKRTHKVNTADKCSDESANEHLAAHVFYTGRVTSTAAKKKRSTKTRNYSHKKQVPEFYRRSRRTRNQRRCFDVSDTKSLQKFRTQKNSKEFSMSGSDAEEVASQKSNESNESKSIEIAASITSPIALSSSSFFQEDMALDSLERLVDAKMPAHAR